MTGKPILCHVYTSKVMGDKINYFHKYYSFCLHICIFCSTFAGFL